MEVFIRNDQEIAVSNFIENYFNVFRSICLGSRTINQFQVIKMYAWEIPFQKMVGQKRADELKEVRKATILRTVFIGFMIFTERAAMFITILTFVLFGNSMSATIVSTNSYCSFNYLCTRLPTHEVNF